MRLGTCYTSRPRLRMEDEVGEEYNTGRHRLRMEDGVAEM